MGIISLWHFQIFTQWFEKWLWRKSGRHTNLLAKQFHQAFIELLLFFLRYRKWQFHLKILHQNNCVCKKSLYLVHFCLSFHKILYILSPFLFEISVRLLIFNPNIHTWCRLFMAKYLLWVIYFIYNWDFHLADKKSEYSLHPLQIWSSPSAQAGFL